MKSHVTSEMHVTAENRFGSFTGKYDLVAKVPHGSTEKAFRYAVSIDTKRLRVPDRVAEMIRDVVLPDRDREEFGSGFLRHFPANLALIRFGAVKGESKCTDWFPVVARRRPQNGAEIYSTAELTTHGNVRTKAQSNSFVQRVS